MKTADTREAIHSGQHLDASPTAMGTPVVHVQPPEIPDQLQNARLLGHHFESVDIAASDLRPTGAGQPLPASLLDKMEQALQTDLSAVRVHLGSQPDLIGARAFTQGRDIVFSHGSYQPDSARGQALIGHELVHVLQQSAGRVATQPGSSLPLNLDADLEAEADRLGQQAASTGSAPHPYPSPANLGETGQTQPIQGYWGESWLKQWRASRLRNAAPNRSRYEDSKDRVQRELRQLSEKKVVSGELEQIAPYAWENTATERNTMLGKHLVKTGRATAPEDIPSGPAQTPSGLDAMARLQQAAQQRVVAQRERNRIIDEAIVKNIPRQIKRDLNPEERAYHEGLKVPEIKAPTSISPYAAKQPGGPQPAKREGYSKMILEGMEAAVNANKDPGASHAHFYSRHGAQTDLVQHASRVVAGYGPDTPRQIGVGGSTGSAVGLPIPNYTVVGERPPAESSRFASHTGQLDTITEAIAQASHHQSGRIQGTVLPEHHQTSVQQDTQVTVPIFNQHTNAPVIGPNGVQLTYQQTQTNTHTENRTTDLPSKDRLTVGLRDRTAFGESVALDPNAVVPNLGKGDPLTAANLQTRANALQRHHAIKGATVVLDLDKRYGGFTPQTAFPDRSAQAGLSARYEGEITTNEHTNLGGNLSTQTGHVSRERPLVPFAPRPQSRREEQIMKENLDRLPEARELPNKSDADLVGLEPRAKQRFVALRLERQARLAALKQAPGRKKGQGN